ncbi:hypothetical protein B0H10DRAFT_524808 [Mycena sp. CBHHK59/15]|nr:hypothetical protein B0H10DRAFT_524808 [Mycena sp. CBHHK59/15]
MHTLRFCCLCFLSILACQISAAPTNHTIDDTSPLIQYLPDASGLCVGCIPTDEFGGDIYDSTTLYNGTVTAVVGERTIAMNFVGTALRIFTAVPPDPVEVSTNGSVSNYRAGQTTVITLDGQRSGQESAEGSKFARQTAPGYYDNVLYSNNSMPDANHRLLIQVSAGDTLYLDYIIYASNDLDSTISSSTMPSSPISTETSPASPTESSSPIPSSPIASSPIPPSPISSSPIPSALDASASQIVKKRLNIAAIAGGAVGGLAGILFIIIFLFLCRSHRKKLSAADTADEKYTPSLGGTLLSQRHSNSEDSDSAADVSPGALAQEVRFLRQQMQRRPEEDRMEAGSIVSSESGSVVQRSLSTMKREQTRVVRDHYEGYSAGRDLLVHTDSGLRLTAGWEVDEVPPTYVTE